MGSSSRLLASHSAFVSDTSNNSEVTRSDAWEDDYTGDDDTDIQVYNSDIEADSTGEDSDIHQEEYQLWLKAIEKAQEALTKKQKSLGNESSKAQKVEETVARAQLIVNNLYVFDGKQQVYMVNDWENDGVEVELKLDPQYENANEEADALFAQARKLKRGSQVVKDLLEEAQQGLQVLQDCQNDLQTAKDTVENSIDEGRLRLVQDRLRRTVSMTQFQEPKNDFEAKHQRKNHGRQQQQNSKKPALGTPASNTRKLQTPNGATILVGRNRRGNEYLTFTQARGNDVWMHARGTPGAHVLILDRRGSVPPTEDCLEFAANVAAFYSDGRTEAKVPVTVAEPKHLLKPRNAPLGAVKLRQEVRVIYGCPDLVPDDLKEARAESGVYATNEYRSTDKAKHRRRTQQVADHKRKQRQLNIREKQKRKRKNQTKDDE